MQILAFPILVKLISRLVIMWSPETEYIGWLDYKITEGFEISDFGKDFKISVKISTRSVRDFKEWAAPRFFLHGHAYRHISYWLHAHSYTIPALMHIHSLVPRPPPFFVLRFSFSNTGTQLPCIILNKKWGGLGNEANIYIYLAQEWPKKRSSRF